MNEKAKKHEKRIDDLAKSSHEQHKCSHANEKRLEEIKDMLENENSKVSNRVDVIEKLLKFSNL